MKRFLNPWVVLVCLVASPVVLVLLMDRHFITSWKFARQNKAYYAQVTRAFDDLIVRSGGERYEVPHREVNSLPTILRDLNPEYVIVQTNFVMLRIGGGLMSKRIIWGAPTGEGLHFWQLSISAGDGPPLPPRVVYEEYRAAPLINRLK